MNRKSIFAILLTISALLWFGSCTQYNLELEYNKQNEKIDDFVKKQVADTSKSVVYNQGVARIVIEQGEGTPLSPRGIVSFYYAGYNFKSYSISNSNLFDTNSEQVAASAGWNLTDASFEPVRFALSDESMLEGLRLGLDGVKIGEHCMIVFSGRFGFGNQITGTIPANSPLAFEIWVTDIEN